jgi:serine/threonine protein kinase
MLYAAYSDRLGRRVTVTVYPAPAEEQARQRFDHAAATAQRLAVHPSVLAVHDWGHGADGRPWVVTDPQPAETSDTLLRADGPLPVEQALRIGVLVAGALETAHRAGIVHGDLSPARLVLGPQGEPLVADIGLAEFSHYPGFGALHNPIRYFAPPEVLERTGVSPASDVYSLAATVYALLAGGAPHEKPADITDSNASLLLRILQIEVPPIVRPGEDIDGVEAALRSALAHAADKRPLRVLDLAWSLRDVQRNLGLPVVEPVVMDLGSPEHPTAARRAAQPPELPPSAPPDPDTLPAWYTESQSDAADTGGTGLVHLFSDTPPDVTDRSRGAPTPHWATGLGHLAGPSGQAGYDEQDGQGQPWRPGEPRPPDEPRQPDEPPRPAAVVPARHWAPTNGYHPNGHPREPLTGIPPTGFNGRGNGVGHTPMAGSDDDQRPVPTPPIDVARRRDPLERPARHPYPPWGDDPEPPLTGLHRSVDADSPPGARGPSTVPPLVPRRRVPGEQASRPDSPPGARGHPWRNASPTPGSGAFPAAERSRSGSALERARQARMRRQGSSGPTEPQPGQRAAAPQADKGPAPAPAGAPAVPVIVLIVVVVLLTLGVAYMVITGDGTSEPVDEQPGASGPGALPSLDQA